MQSAHDESPSALSLSEVKARLAADEALILIVPHGADTYVFAVSPEQEQDRVLDNATAPVARLVARLRCRMDEASCISDADLDATSDQLGELTGIDAFFPRFDREAAHRLYTTFFQPLEPALGKARRIFVTVAGPLGGLPLPVPITQFDPAKDKADAGDAETLKRSAWLGDRYAFVTLPAVAAVRIARPLPDAAGARRDFLGYGAPSLQGAARSVEQGGRRIMRGALQGIAKTPPMPCASSPRCRAPKSSSRAWQRRSMHRPGACGSGRRRPRPRSSRMTGLPAPGSSPLPPTACCRKKSGAGANRGLTLRRPRPPARRTTTCSPRARQPGFPSPRSG